MIAKDYLLTSLLEECSEVVQAASKSIKFGIDSKHPDRTTTNGQDIIQEFYEIVAIIEMLQENGTIPVWSEERQEFQKEAKKLRVLKHMNE